jgi:DNA-binding NtrC family response regulator
MKILLIEDDPQAAASMSKLLVHLGHSVLLKKHGEEALEWVQSLSSLQVLRSEVEVVLTDLRMPGLSGLEFLRGLRVLESGNSEQIPVVLMTAFGRVEDAVTAMKLGAVDFLEKPFPIETLEALLQGLESRRRPLSDGQTFSLTHPSVGYASRRTKRFQMELEQVAATRATVLVRGESGSGKERAARLIHERSSRSGGRFVVISCAALPEHLIESELFGHERGAYSGADSVRLGLIEMAHEGTLYLDDVGELSLMAQAKLLRVLQEGEVRRLGSNFSRKVDFRVIASTSRELSDLVHQGKFRQDLQYRLEVIPLEVPPLRERLEDLEALVVETLKDFHQLHPKPNVPEWTSDFLETLRSHSWPGNVRELQNVIERAWVLNEGARLDRDCLMQSGFHPLQVSLKSDPSTFAIKLGTPLREVEEELIEKTLEATEGDRVVAAKLLGVHPRTLARRMNDVSGNH